MVYLDFNAATPLDKDAAQVFMETSSIFANPSNSIHKSGAEASERLEVARSQIANLLSVSKQEVMFTSGATEGAWLSIVGIALGLPQDRRSIFVVSTEHKAVLDAAKIAAELANASLEVLPVDRTGQIDEDTLRLAISRNAGVLIAMAVNNETGSITNVVSLAERCSANGVILISDLTQAVGKTSITETVCAADVSFFSGHKIYGPRGTGVLVVKRAIQKRMTKLMKGGGQERGIRGGTENLAGIASLAYVLEKATTFLDQDCAHYTALRNDFEEQLRKLNVRFLRTIDTASSVPNTLSLRFPGYDAEAILANAPIVEASTGSACDHANPEPSHVLIAMGLSREEAAEVIRFSFGRSTTLEDVRLATGAIADSIAALEGTSEG